MANVVDGTTISTSRTAGLEITLATENPVDITSTGRIVTTGLYAIEDTVQAVDAITNSGKLQGQYGVDVYGAGSPIVNYGSIAGTAGDGVFFIDSGTLTNGSTTDKTASISGSAAALGIRGSTRPDTVTNYGSLVSANKAVSDTGTTLLTVNNYGKISGHRRNTVALELRIHHRRFLRLRGRQDRQRQHHRYHCLHHRRRRHLHRRHHCHNGHQLWQCRRRGYIGW
jgi:hypothetical protein